MVFVQKIPQHRCKPIYKRDLNLLHFFWHIPLIQGSAVNERSADPHNLFASPQKIAILEGFQYEISQFYLLA